MAFCKYSTELVKSEDISLSCNFITDYLPFANEYCVRVYLLGLYKCQNPDNYDNTLENFAKTLNMSTDDVESCFLYWQEQGLVNVINVNPIEIRYLPVKKSNNYLKKFDKHKYENFNVQAQELIDGRMITPTEFAEYYVLMESLHIEPTALIMIIKYCTNLKGSNVGYQYILTVAKNWAYEGVLTASAVEEKLMQHEQVLGDIKEVLKALGVSRNANFEERQLYLKWTKELDFSKEVILFVAKSLKRKGGCEKLDKKLLKYYELKLFSIKEIEDFEQNKEELYNTAKEVTKSIGVYYENLENVIDVYISSWINMGFNKDSLKLIADFCFKNNTRNLEGVNQTVKKFFALGLTTEESIKQYLSQILTIDEQIKTLINLCGLSRNVNSTDREFYNIWTNQWGFSLDIIKYACELAQNKVQPMQYINKILSNWKNNNIKTLEQAKENSNNLSCFEVKKNDGNFVGRSYSQQEINALFDTLGEVKI